MYGIHTAGAMADLIIHVTDSVELYGASLHDGQPLSPYQSQIDRSDVTGLVDVGDLADC